MKHKKLWLPMLAAAALAFTACSSDDTVDSAATSESNLIGFNVLQDNALATRGTATTASNFTTTPGNFSVWAYKSDNSAYISNLKVEYKGENTSGYTMDSNEKWGYSGAYYWPNEALTFYGVSPADAATLINTSGTVTFNYQIASSVGDQKDLMTAYNGTATKNDVSMAFKHALSQIVFAATTTKSDLTVTISSIKLNKISATNSTDTWTISSTDGITSVTPSTTASYDASLNTAAYSTGINNTATEITGTDGVLLLCPQTLIVPEGLTAGSASTTAPSTEATGQYAAVTFELKNGTTMVNSGTVYIPLNTGTSGITEWKAGYTYTYTLSFDGSVIKFTGTAANWTSGGSASITVSPSYPAE